MTLYESRDSSGVVSLKDIYNGKIDEQTIDLDTITTYLDVFKRLYLIDNQETFSSNIRSSVRIKQTKKRHLCDHHLHVLS